MIECATVAVRCRPVCLLRKTFIAGAFLSTIAMLVTASAQSDYPNRPVQLIVPYGAGGIADVGMRILADQLTGRLKQQFVVENRPGAGGILAAKAAASAAPDGYTVLMTGNNNAISASLFTLPYNIVTDFASTSTTSFKFIAVDDAFDMIDTLYGVGCRFREAPPERSGNERSAPHPVEPLLI